MYYRCIRQDYMHVAVNVDAHPRMLPYNGFGVAVYVCVSNALVQKFRMISRAIVCQYGMNRTNLLGVVLVIHCCAYMWCEPTHAHAFKIFMCVIDPFMNL